MWATFDAVRCISLKTREDRRAKVTARFEAVGVNKLMRFFLAEKHAKGSRFGCYESHYLCIKEAYDAGKENVLIFEDDVVFNPGWEKVVADCTEFMAQNKGEWDALFLGSANWYPQTRSASHPDIWQGVCAACHAYVVSRQGMQKYLEGLPLDESVVATKGHDIEQFRVWSRTFFHKDSGAIYQEMLDSDNEWVKLQPNQRLLETALQFEINVLQPLKRYTILVPDRWRPMLVCQVKFLTLDAAGKVLELGITAWCIPFVWMLFFAYALYLFIVFKVSTWKNQIMMRLRLKSDAKGATGTGLWSWAAPFLG